MKLLNKIDEPEVIHLLWKSSEDVLYIVGELRKKADKIVFRYTPEKLSFHEAREKGFEDYPAFPFGAANFSSLESCMDVFDRRICSRKRSDFKEWLQYHGLDPEIVISDFALLAYTGGELPSDRFSFAIIKELEEHEIVE